jgi:hypothetical protein
MMLESRWRFFRKNRSTGYSHLYRVAIFCASLFRVALLSIAWPIFKARGKHSSVERGMKKWTARLFWALGFENWINNY